MSVPKNPNVGIGKGSEDAYVYVFVNNKTAPAGTADSKTTYFTINSGWKAVDATAVEGEPTHYLGGLFVYVGEGTEATPLIASKTEDKWTGELFNQVTTPKDTEKKDFANPATMDVNCFIYAADNTAEGSSASALTAATDWANGLK